MTALLLALALAAPAEPLERFATADALEAALKPSGKPQVLHLWALWCAPCIAELPRQVALAKEARARGAEVLFVSADGFEKADTVAAHLRKLGAFKAARQGLLSTEVDPAELTKRIDPRWYGALPATFLFDRDGKLQMRVLGEIDGAEERRLLEALPKVERRTKRGSPSPGSGSRPRGK